MAIMVLFNPLIPKSCSFHQNYSAAFAAAGFNGLRAPGVLSIKHCVARAMYLWIGILLVKIGLSNHNCSVCTM